jgi:hypothetical protein
MTRMDPQREKLRNMESPLGVWQNILRSNRKGKEITPTSSDCLHSQNIDIRCVVNLTVLVKTLMQFFTVPIPTECSRFEACNMIHLHVTMRDISGECCYSMLKVLLSQDSAAIVCSTF